MGGASREERAEDRGGAAVNPRGRIDYMEEPQNPEARLGRLAAALSEMAAPLGYGVAAVNNMLGVYELSDPLKKCIALLCSVVVHGKMDRRASAEALLREYESGAFHTAFFFDKYGGMEFPGGPLEEIELKAAVGWTARPAKGWLW